MAAPHVTGTAALVKQAHPDWRKVKYWDAAIENTADPSGVADYTTRGAGTGLVQALPAVQTQVVAIGDKDMGVLNYGFNELTRDFNDTDVVHLRNFGNSWATFNVADTPSLSQGSPHSVSVYGSTVSVPPRSSRDVVVKLSVPAATAGGASFPGDPSFPFNDVAGVLTFSPVGSSNNGVTLRVPYYMVPQAVSNVDTRVETTRASKKIPTTTTTATSTNYRGAAVGSTWWFDWGIKDKRDHGLHSNDIQAVGATVYPGASSGGQDLLYFAISTNHRWSNAAQNVFDVFVDVNGDGTPDFQIQAGDEGALLGQDFNGVMDVAVADLATGDGFIDYTAIGATDSNTIMLPVDSEALCSASYGVDGPCYGGRFTYTADAASWTDGTVDTTDMTGSFNPTSPAVNSGMFDQIAPNGSVSEALTVNPAEQAIAPSLGWLVISQENKSREESQLIPVGNVSHHDH